MKRPNDPAVYMTKAERTLAAALSLLRDTDTEGACNRAYYAMFNAAHAALIVVGVEPPEDGFKTHNTVIGEFGKHLVLSGLMDGKLGRVLNEVQRLRQAADYLGDPPLLKDATWAVEQAKIFIEQVREKFGEPQKAYKEKF